VIDGTFVPTNGRHHAVHRSPHRTEPIMKRTILAVFLSAGFLTACGGGSSDPEVATSSQSFAISEGSVSAPGAPTGVDASAPPTLPVANPIVVDSLAFEITTVRTFAGGRTLVPVVAKGADGAVVTEPVLEWRIADDSIASLTPGVSSAVVIGTAPGASRITVSAAPRQQSVDLVVLAAPTGLRDVPGVLPNGRDFSGASPVWTDGDPAAQAAAQREAALTRAFLTDFFGAEAPPLAVALTRNPWLIEEWVAGLCLTEKDRARSASEMACAPTAELPASWWILSGGHDLARVRFAHADHHTVSALTLDVLPGWIFKGLPVWMRNARFDDTDALVPGNPGRELIEAFKRLGSSGGNLPLGRLLKLTRAEASGNSLAATQTGSGVFVHWIQANHPGVMKALITEMIAGRITSLDASIAWLEGALRIDIDTIEMQVREWVERQ